MTDRGTLSIHDTLLRLPLFQGISQTDLKQVVGHTVFEFTRLETGQTVLTAGESCTALTYLLSGQVSALTQSDDHGYSLEETLHAPTLIQPECLFGLTQRYTHTVSTMIQCDMLTISKAETLRLLADYDIFRTNLLNILSTRAHRLARQPWHTQPHSIREKILRFVSDRCLYPAGSKVLHIGMKPLAEMIGESRLNLSRELHRMQERGLIVLRREHIHIPALEQLFN